MAQWWIIEIKGRYLGKTFATLLEIQAACGPYCTITGNAVNIYSRPPSH